MPASGVVIADAARSPVRWSRTGVQSDLTDVDLLSQTLSGLLKRNHLDAAAITQVHLVGSLVGGEGLSSACRAVGMPASAELRLGEEMDKRPHQSLLSAINRVGRNDVVVVAAIGSVVTPLGWSTDSWLQRAAMAESVAEQSGLEQVTLDRHAIQSRERACAVNAMGEFMSEIIPIMGGGTRCDSVEFAVDETVLVDAGMSAHRPDGFAPEWRLSRLNTARPATGAVALLLVDEGRARELGLSPRARILASACAAPAGLVGIRRATSKALALAGLDVERIDHYEVDDTFPSIPLAWQQAFNADNDRLNPRGGAIALGDLGVASPLRMLVTALSALTATGGRYGIQIVQGCRGLGEAVVVERLPVRRAIRRPTRTAHVRSAHASSFTNLLPHR